MSSLASFALHVLHFVYWCFITARSVWNRSEIAPPLPLTANRTKLPTHIALVLATGEDVDAQLQEEAMLESVEKAVAWCRAAGIGRLTVYDRHGMLQPLNRTDMS